MKKYCMGIAVALSLLATGAQAGDAAAGAKKAEACAACHGATGTSENPTFPNLAGQYEDYLRKALHDYKSGARKNPIMAGMAAPLSDEDIADLAAHFASQPGKLFVLKH